jgi:hypothetical protein
MMIRRIVVALCLIVLGRPLLAQENPKAPSAPAMTPGQMDAMMKAISPGEPHKLLARMVGKWSFTSKAWMAPGEPPAESSGTMQAELLLGGRYVEHLWKGNLMGMPFEGRGTDGYDNVAKQYVSSWVDNMGTGIMYQTGTCEATHRTCTYTGDVSDPVSGRKMAVRSVITWLDDNTFRNEMFGNDPSGKEVKMMEITAKRD